MTNTPVEVDEGQLALSVRDLRVVYPSGTVAVDKLSLDIQRGHVLGVIGPSGCGKSTLLYAVAGLQLPALGSIRWHNSRGDSHPLSMVFQKDTLLPWLTVEENVGLCFRLDRSWRHKRDYVRSLLDIVGLGASATKYPYELSGGMRRRVAFLSAVAPQPAVMLLDEPFSAVDEPTRVAIHQDVIKIIDELDMTVMLVTHDLAEALTLSDRVAIMTNGPGRVYKEHAVPFGRHRDVLELRHEPAFLEQYGLLWEELSTQISRSGTPPRSVDA